MANDFRASMLRGDVAHFTCLIGTAVREVGTPRTRTFAPPATMACRAHVADLVRDIECLKHLRGYLKTLLGTPPTAGRKERKS